MNVGRAAVASVGLLLLGCGSQPAAPPPTSTYHLRLEASGGEPHSALLSLGGISGEVRVVAGGAVLARVTTGTSPLVLLVGSLNGQDLLEVETATPGAPPTVAVVDASAGQAGGYQRIAAQAITVTWVAVD